MYSKLVLSFRTSVIKNTGFGFFEVVNASVCKNYVKGYRLFGTYVPVLFEEKANQDVLQDESKSRP